MIPQADISRIEEATDIVEIISEYVSLKKDGASFKGCCPFHNEKTPSFKVNPAKQIYKCFGCGKGGDAVSFVMEHDHLSYPDALRKLAKRAHIEIEERERTPEEIARESKREAMFMLTKQVNDFFVEQIQKNENAMAYAEKRWGKKYVEEMGIGYAPGSAVFMDWVKLNCLNIDLLKELHIVGENDKGGLYAQFRQRITIPQRSRANLINGWTCRDLSGRDDTPKYLNSSDSELYQKSELLFGIDVARPEIRATGKVYVAEGAPDVMRMQILGVNNAVAPLGTGKMGEAQFKLLASCFAKTGVRQLCILPDGDTNKEDGSNPGRATAITIGKAALQLGYVVTIKPIPDTIESTDENGKPRIVKRTKKEDPDSYFTTKAKFRDTKEEDFILWYANYRFQDDPNTQETNEIIREITGMIAMGDDEVRMEGYLKSLKDVYKESSVWNKALKAAKVERQKEEVEKKAFSKDLFTKYGFFEERGCYFALQGAVQVQWSNFTMEPLFHIKDALNPKRLYALHGEHGGNEIIELKQEDLVSLSKFRQRIEGLGNYIFEAGEPQLIKLKRYLYEQTETATEIVQLGWQRQGFYAFGNGVFYQGRFHKSDHYGIVRLEDLGNFYLPGSSDIYKEDSLFQFEKRFVHLAYSTVSLNEVATAMLKVFGDNGKVGIAFLIATLFRDIITANVKAFPMLNLFGPKGSGKSELGHTLMSFFIIQNIPPNLSNSTIAALSEAVAQCSNAIVHLDEFKNNIDLDKREFLKGLWDSAGRTRMNMDRDKKREQTRVDSGVIISGQEMATPDIALCSRFIYLTFNKTEFTTAESNAFAELDHLRKLGFSHLTLQILNQRETFKQNFAAMYNATSSDVMNRLGKEICESRIVNNWTTVAAAFRTLENSLDLPFTYKELLDICIEGIKRQNKECKSNNEIAAFWNVIAYLQQEGQLIMDSDFKIEYVSQLKTTKAKIEFDHIKSVLLLRRGKAFQLYKRFAKQCGENPLPEGSLKYYLENSKEFLGIKQSVRFKTSINGRDQFKQDPMSQQMVPTSQIDMALCFDYEQLSANHEITLEIETLSND